MELDDFKNNSYRKPGEKAAEESCLCINDLFKRVEDSFKKQMRHKRYFIILLFMFSVIYLALAGKTEENAGLLLIVTGFLSGAVYLFFRYKPLPDNIYFMPLSQFVDAAVRRLKYFTLIDWIIIIPILILLGIGGGLHLVNRLSHYTDRICLIIVIWIIFYTGLCIFGYFAGRRNWHDEHSGLQSYLEKFRESL